MISRQVKQRMARVKLRLFLFHLKFVKMKRFFTILEPSNNEFRKTYLRSIQIFEKINEKDSFA